MAGSSTSATSICSPAAIAIQGVSVYLKEKAYTYEKSMSQPIGIII